MWKLDHKEGRVPKNWCFQTVVLEMTLESPLESKIKPVNLQGNQPWMFIGRADTEAKASVLWPPDAKSWLTGKDPDAGKDRAGGEEGDREWDGWIASPTQWTWVWTNSGRWWRTEKPSVLQSMGLQSRTGPCSWTTATTTTKSEERAGKIESCCFYGGITSGGEKGQ